MQTENSFTGDDFVYGSGIGGSAQFIRFRDILIKDCASCHSEFLGFTEQDFIDNNYVIAGVPSASLLFTRIRGSGTGGFENMPPSYSLTSSEVDDIRNWILGI